VLDDRMAILLADKPGEAVVLRVRLAVVQCVYGPDAVQTRLLQQASRIKSFVPLGDTHV
jgi:hypothetical protein